MSKCLVLDTEVTIFQKGNPFARSNRLCYLGIFDGSRMELFDFLHGLVELSLDDCRTAVSGYTELVGFNLKFDSHWCRRYGIPLPDRVWDCQYAHFLLTGQKDPYPSLDTVCAHYGIEGKFSFIKENYWDKGINTPDIPMEEMLLYLGQDLRCTWEVYQRQKKELEVNPTLYRLFRLHMTDLLVLAEMEYNGLKLNTEECEKQQEVAKTRIESIDKELQSRCPNCPVNWDSVDHVSSYLYGGSITIPRKEPSGVYKTGDKAGQVKYSWTEDVYTLLRLVEPIKGSELKKEGYWSTSEDVLKQVKQVKEVKLLLERAKLTKLLDYLSGLPDLIVEKDWEDKVLHGQYNQCVARTGRLSSSGPNLQNLPDPVLKLIETRYV